MLTSMRKTSSSLFVKVLFVLLIASFAVWGIGDILRPSAGGGPIEVGDQQVSIASINQEFGRLLDDRSRRIGIQLDPAMGMQLGLLDLSINNLVSRAQIENLATDLGMRVGDESIIRFIGEDLGFTTADGRFDRAAFEANLRQRGITEDMFVEQLRQDIGRDTLLRLLGSGVRIPVTVAETLHRYNEETRDADYVQISADALDDPTPPDQSTLNAYYEANSDRYMAPELRSAQVVILDPEALAASVVVDEEQLNEEFLYQRDALFVPERRVIEQMILADSEIADAAAGALGEGRTFATVATEIAGQDPETLTMGSFTADEWFLPEIAETLFDGEIGAFSDPVETPLGWRIYQVAALVPAHEPTLDEVRESLIGQIATRIASDTIYDLAGQFQDEIAGGATLSEAAQALDLPLETFGPVAANGTALDGSEILVPGGADVVSAVFGETLDVASNQYDLDGGGVFFVQVTEVTETVLRELDDVRDQVLSDWTASGKFESAQEQADAIRSAVLAGASLSEEADALGLEVRTAPGIRRDGAETGGLPPLLAARLFDTEIGDAEVGDATVDRSVFVAQLTTINPAPDDAEMVDNLRLQLSAEATNDLYLAIGTDLQERYEPRVQYDYIQQSFVQTYVQ